MTPKNRLARQTAIIIPVYNEEKVVRGVIENVLQSFGTVICVNDGSKDRSAEEIANTRAVLINHPINMGQGAALQTGLEYARSLPYVRYFVHFDADGQHDLNDVQRMLGELATDRVDIVLGSRFLRRSAIKKVPFKKRLLLWLAVRYTEITTHLKLTDAHNGMRAFNRHAAEVLNITLPDMAHASELVSLIRQNKLRYAEVPVTIHYTDYSKAKGQSIFNAVNILFDMMTRNWK